MPNLRILILAIFGILAAAAPCPSGNAVENLALHKTYTVSPLPNYYLSAPSSDNTSLTDGIRTKDYFWTQKTTVGWQDSGIVEIRLDLGQTRDIGNIVVGTARGRHADVDYPAHVYAFVGRDPDRLQYVGDVVRDEENEPGPYRTRNFVLPGIGVKGRHVVLLAVPKGHYFFCDEIEVTQGSEGKDNAEGMTLGEARAYTKVLWAADIRRNHLARLVDFLSSSDDNDPGWLGRRQELRKRISSPVMKPDALIPAEDDLYRLRAERIRRRLPGKKLVLEIADPFGNRSPVDDPAEESERTLDLVMPEGGHAHGAFWLTNLDVVSMRFSVSLPALKGNPPSLTLRQVPFVQTAAMQYVPDPLVPANQAFSLRPGESRMVFLSTLGVAEGHWSGEILISSAAGMRRLPFTLTVLPVRLPRQGRLDSVNWAYLDFRPVRNRRKEAVRDLLAHRTSAIVVPPGRIPSFGGLDPSGAARFAEYLALHRGAAKFLLFLGWRESDVPSGINGPSGNVLWKAKFREWYESLIRTAEKNGVSRNQLFLYPFDEPAPVSVDRLVALASWAHTEIPGIQFYATLSTPDALRALPQLDVAQLLDRDMVLAGRKRAGGSIWLYDSRGVAKTLSPHTYYRLMAWKAYSLGFSGIGFWSYADTGWGEEPGSAWDDFDGKQPDYAVVYEGERGTILSSRRWEAWTMGIEDYELLALYEEAEGRPKALALVQEVLANSKDPSTADRVRGRILEALSAKMDRRNVRE